MTDAFDAKTFLKQLTSRPGVYKMLDAHDAVLYVGKARNLKKRVASYFRPAEQLAPKTRTMMSHMQRVEVVVTHTEGEALLLEGNLIKSLAPRYNVILRDDKSYPYIHRSAGPYPRFRLHRGARNKDGRYFGPYPSAGAVRQTLNLLEKLFRVRNCEESVFANRTRPCLQFQIKRCSAPCVGRISGEAYAADVQHAELMLSGRSSEVITELGQKMEQASAAQAFEQAAVFRDQIARISAVQEKQYVEAGAANLDIIAAATLGSHACVQVIYIRDGRQLDSRQYFPRHGGDTGVDVLLRAFVLQYYLDGDNPARIPGELVLPVPLEDHELLQSTLAEKAGHKVRLAHKVRTQRQRWLHAASDNARIALQQRVSADTRRVAQMDALQQALGLDRSPAHIECFDISHSRGERTVASCVVFRNGEPDKSLYRKFNIDGIIAGDDYEAMRQAVERRFAGSIAAERERPDLLLIDGGKGQFSAVRAVLERLQITDLEIIGVAKGPERKPGMETLVLPPGDTEVHLQAGDPALHLMQQVRDEAHRFAINAHRQRRARARTTSPLEQLPGIGPKRRQQLLRHFGGLQGIERAGIEDLARVQGISQNLAKAIYDAYHES